MNNCGCGRRKSLSFRFHEIATLTLLATTMLAHRTYGLAFFKGVAT